MVTVGNIRRNRGLMDFGKFREKSVRSGKIGNYIKKLCMPFANRRLHSVGGRHHDDDCQRNAIDVTRKAYTFFYHFRSLPSTRGICLIETDIARSILKLEKKSDSECFYCTCTINNVCLAVT